MHALLSGFVSFLVAISLCLCVLFLLLYLRRQYLRLSFRRAPDFRRSTPVSVCVVLGSGGHTTEMLRLMQAMPSDRYSPRYYVLADTDSTSQERLAQAESSGKNGSYKIFWIPRSREVIFIESMCRVESLSTTGKLLYYLGIADEVFVQWPQLRKKYPTSVYLGRLV